MMIVVTTMMECLLIMLIHKNVIIICKMLGGKSRSNGYGNSLKKSTKVIQNLYQYFPSRS